MASTSVRPVMGAENQVMQATDGDLAPTILVVDDDVLVRTVVAAYLREFGFNVVEAGRADEAIRVLQAGVPIDLVFSDVNMPGDMDGFGLAAWLHQEHPDIKVMLTTGAHAVVQRAGEVVTRGEVLAKPYKYDVLLLRLREMLGR
jgi:two-component system, response regulator PdtaR